MPLSITMSDSYIFGTDWSLHYLSLNDEKTHKNFGFLRPREVFPHSRDHLQPVHLPLVERDGRPHHPRELLLRHPEVAGLLLYPVRHEGGEVRRVDLRYDFVDYDSTDGNAERLNPGNESLYDGNREGKGQGYEEEGSLPPVGQEPPPFFGLPPRGYERREERVLLQLL